jgi:hypothetical protein
LCAAPPLRGRCCRRVGCGPGASGRAPPGSAPLRGRAYPRKDLLVPRAAMMGFTVDLRSVRMISATNGH